MHLHMLQMHLSSILQNDASPEINASLQKHHHAKRFEIKCSLSCCCRANTSCEAKQIPNDFQKHHSHIQRPQTHSPKRLFSTKTFSTVNETCPDMMASCSFPENTKNNDLYLVRRRDLVKTNLNTSASYLPVNSRVKCSMHSSPNIVTAHRVYPYTFIRRRLTFDQPTFRPANDLHHTTTCPFSTKVAIL